MNTKKEKDKNIRIDAEVYRVVRKIASKTDRKIKAVIAIAVYDYWEKI